jgi:hypothetical protein
MDVRLRMRVCTGGGGGLPYVLVRFPLTVCLLSGVCGGGGVGWRWMALCVLCVLVGCLRCSLGGSKIGVAGGTAIGAGLQYLPSLTVLEYVRSIGHVEEAKGEKGGCVIAGCGCVLCAGDGVHVRDGAMTGCGYDAMVRLGVTVYDRGGCSEHGWLAL